MHNAALVFAALCAYIGLLFLIGLYAEKRARAGRNLADHPWVYALAMAVYCTSWTYYGSVGQATNSGLLYLATYLGPTLMMFLGWQVLRKMIAIKGSVRVSSIADFISARYDRSLLVAALATLLALVGNIPYIALQIKAVIATFDLMVGAAHDSDSIWQGHFIDEAVILAIIVLTISIGLRRLDAAERHPGVMAVLAAESLVKLAAFLAVGIFVTYFLNDGFSALLNSAAVAARLAQMAGPVGPEAGDWYMAWITQMALAMAAIVFLPRQFHVMVVENSNPRHLRTAIWLFPLYLLLINLFVLPIAAGGLAAGYPVESADTFVLRLPLANGQPWLSLFVFIGGFSAALGMVMVSSVATSIMFTNHILVPVLHWFPALRFLRGYLLQCRWAAVSAMVGLGYWFAKTMGDSYLLSGMGHIAFAAFLQFAPVMLGALFWRRGNRSGAELGLAGGIAVWTYTLFLPALIKSGWLPLDILEHGPGGIEFLRPEQLFGLAGLPPLTHCVFWSLLANTGLYVLGSLCGRQSAEEKALAERFVGSEHNPAAWAAGIGGENYVDLAAKTQELQRVFSQYLSPAASARAVDECLAQLELEPDKPITVRQLMALLADAEARLAGSIGAASAHQAMLEGCFLTAREARDLAHVYGEILAELNVSPDEMKRRVDHYQELSAAMSRHARELENKVAERTADLGRAVESLMREVDERRRAELELLRSYEEQERMHREVEETHSQLLQSEKMASIGQLAAGVAHEINNPIGFVHSNLGTLQHYFDSLLQLLAAYEQAEALLPADSPAARSVRAAKDEADLDYLKGDVAALLAESRDGVVRVKRIVQDLKDFSHVDALDWQTADLHQGLESTLNVVWNELKYRAEVVRDYGRLPLVECMPSQLNQVFMNLLLNAAQAIEDRGTITIHTESDGESVRIDIGDTGKGIAPEHLPRVFEPFFTTKPVGKGTGLGLSISYGIVRKHGGSIGVTSEVGKGSTFRITLPLCRDAAAAEGV